MDWVAMCLGFIGALHVAQGTPKMLVRGLIIYCIASVLWITYSIINGLIPLFLTTTMYLIMEGYAAYKWRNK